MKVTVSVINDLSFDQRVHKVCSSLEKEGYQVLLIGRKQNKSQPISRSYKTKRLKLLFEKGALFYAFFNFRLFWVLLFTKTDVYHSNDLDTLLPNFLVSRIKSKPLIYDSHEYFTGVPEIQKRKFVKTVWTKLERFIFPKLKHIFTVNNSIASLYEKDYGIRPQVMRNIPPAQELQKVKSRADLKLPADKKILILQGAGINIDRGAEELLEAMSEIPNAILLIIGDGDVVEELKDRASNADIKGKIVFKNRLPYAEMMQYTMNADLGLTLDKDTNINYKFSLPNKIFDYIRAGIPVVSTPIIEVKNVIEKYDIGAITPHCSPLAIAETVNSMFSNPIKMEQYRENIKLASKQLSWENEVTNLLTIYKTLHKK